MKTEQALSAIDALLNDRSGDRALLSFLDLPSGPLPGVRHILKYYSAVSFLSASEFAEIKIASGTEPRRARLRALLEPPEVDVDDNIDTAEDSPPAPRFALLESQGGRRWLSVHETPEAAAKAHDQQENSDWDIVSLVDLDTGKDVKAETTTVFDWSGDE